jgi:hypothetical protein
MDLEVVREIWEMQGAPAAGAAEARAQVHHAVARVAAASRALLGDAGARLEWLSQTRAFATPVISGSRAFRVAFAPAELAMLITDADGAPVDSFALDGKTAADAARWIAAQTEQLGAAKIASDAAPPFALPDHAVGKNGTFAKSDALEDLTRSFGNAVRALLCATAMARSDQPVRIAPEALHVVGGVAFAGGNGAGLGYCDGDAEIATPYYYVKPCPLPKYEVDSLPELEGGGEWKTSGSWFGGILHRSEWTWYDAEQLQAGCVVSFLDSGVDAARELFGG